MILASVRNAPELILVRFRVHAESIGGGTFGGQSRAFAAGAEEFHRVKALQRRVILSQPRHHTDKVSFERRRVQGTVGSRPPCRMKALAVVAKSSAQMSDTAVFPVVFRTSATRKSISRNYLHEVMRV